jgi:hypothetical protein
MDATPPFTSPNKLPDEDIVSDLLTGESQARTQVASPALAVTVRVWREVVPVDVEPDPPHPDTKPPTINANMLVVRKFIG